MIVIFLVFWFYFCDVGFFVLVVNVVDVSDVFSFCVDVYMVGLYRGGGKLCEVFYGI